MILFVQTELVTDKLNELYQAFLRSLPLIGIGLVVGIIAVAIALFLANLASRGLDRTGGDKIATNLIGRLVRFALVVIAVLFSLSVAGVPVGLAVQGILENFIAGVILLIRKPFTAGDQIISGDYEGAVETIDLRVTHLIDYDGQLILIPNNDVYSTPLVNLTRRGARRSRMMIGVDYDDDHDAARDLIHEAVTGLEGVLDDPAPEVLLIELGDSSVNFEIRYWTDPDVGSVRRTQDRVLSAAKRALDDAGISIPWPIMTLKTDAPLRVSSNGGP